MAPEGGANNSGTIFKIKPDGTGFAKLHDFSGSTGGFNAYGSLISEGSFLYGMTVDGGANGNGTIFKIMHDGTGFTKLHDFHFTTGSTPWGSLYSDGTFLYGMTTQGGTNDFGVIFKIKPDGTGFAKLLDFAGATNGSRPLGFLVFDGTYLYGMTRQGGINNLGVVFKIKPDGTGFTKLLDFAGATNGSSPGGSLILEGAYLYGLTEAGGANNLGVLFRIKPDGTGYEKLMDFTGTSNGSYPEGSLISDGTYLYGMTAYGGTSDIGTVFKYLIPSGGASITITSQPGGIYNRCEGSNFLFSTDATGTTNITFQWQKFNSGNNTFENLFDGGAYSGTSAKNLILTNIQNAQDGMYRCFIQGDDATPVVTDTAILIVHAMPPLPETLNGERCGPGQVTVSATGALPGEFVWYFDGTTGEPIPNQNDPIYTTDPLTTTTTYWVTIAIGICETARVPVDAIINSVPAKPIITSSIQPVGNTVTICGTANLTLSAPGGFTSYAWSDLSTTQQITVTQSGTYSVVVTNATGCDSPPSDDLMVVFLQPCSNAPPVIEPTTTSTFIGGQVSIDLAALISDADGNLDLSSLIILQQPSSGALATIVNTTLELDYNGILFSGVDVLTIQVCDVFNECTQQQLEIMVVGEIEIYNALSPNNDGKNDIFFIRYIDLLESTKNNKVTIFDRWGDVVFEINDYNNTTRVFQGVSDHGKELPTGTYFYKIDFNGESKTGYISLKR
jgi:gliding motility-associated-like protein